MTHCQIFKKVLPLLLAGALGFSWSAPLRAQNLLQNPNFEEPPHAPEDQSNTITDWIVGGTGHIHSIAEGSTSGAYSAAFNVGNDSQGTTLSQSFPTTVGQKYRVDFDAGIVGPSGGGLQLRVEVLGNTPRLDQTVTPPETGGSAVFQHYQFTFVANSTTTTLRFTDIGLNNGSADTLLDTVAVTLVPTPPPGDLPLANGNFETGPFDTPSVVEGWTVSGNGNIEVKEYGSTSPTHSAALSVGGNSQGNVLSQTFNTVNGRIYTVDFDAGIIGQPSGSLRLQVEVLGSGTLLNQTVTPPASGSSDPNFVSFQHYRFTFTANSSTTTLRFTDIQIGGNNTGADLVLDTVFVERQNLVLNGNFEIPPFFTVGTVANWTVSGNGNIGAVEGSSTSPTHSAAFSAGADSQGDVLSQSFTTVVGATYHLDFDALVAGQPEVTQQLRVEVFSSSTVLDETITPPLDDFDHYHFTFTANSTTTTLQFSNIGLGNANADILLDTVFVEADTVATPTISPNGGNFNDSVQVTLATTTSGATIRYTTNGSDPTASSTLYSGPFTLNSSATVKAKAFKNGFNDSAIASASFTITPTVATPTISPNGGNFNDSVEITLATATSGATIRYTTNGNDPTAGSNLYSGPFTLTNSATVKAKAFKSGSNDSAIASASFTLTVATPTISPNGGNFNDSVQVTLSCATSGVTIRYTTNGSDPTAASTAYTSPFTLNSSATVKAKAFRSGFTDSGIASASFTITPTVATPTISPNGGSFNDSVQVTLATTTSGATIRYTTNGSDPTAGSTQYTGPFTLTSSATVKAKAFRSGFNDSAIASASFTITPTVATPTISPNGGSFDDSVQVTLATATSGATIRYTTNGSDPTAASTLYSGPFTLTSSATVKAKAFRSGFNDSAIASAAFTITPTVATPTISPNGGSFNNSVQVTLASATSGSTIRYTTNGSDPTAASTLYSGPFTLSSSGTVKAKAFKSGFNDSAIASASFTLTVATPTISPNGGSFSDSVQVTLASATSGATIRYTTNGSDPTAASTQYSGPFTLTNSATVKAKAFKSGFTDSAIASASFTVTPSGTVITPTISPNGGNFDESVQVTLACATSGAAIHYTTNGSDPTLGSPQYSGPFVLTNSATVKARAFKSGLNPSAIASANFTAQARADFNADDSTDYLLFNPTNRRTAIWNLQGAAFLSGVYGPTPPSGWTVVCVADIDRNGQPDYILFNASTRQTVIWFLNGSSFAGSLNGPTLPAGWTLIATIDFDGDLKPDYVLFNPSTRRTAIWYLNGAALISGAYGPTLPVGWTLIDALDFNSNGKPDFLLSKSSTRQTAIWYLNNTAFVSSAYGPTPPSGWTLQGAADFNANEKPDYVLFQASTRRTAIWYLNSATFAGSAYGPTLAAGYSLISP